MAFKTPITPRSGLTRRSVLATGAAFTGLAATGLIPQRARAQSRGGTIRVAKGHGQTNDTLDPGSFINGFTVALSYGMHGFLTGVGTDGSLEPSLAESWEADATASSWRFKIRQDVQFHSGKPLTLEDVVVSINHHRGEDSTSAAAPIVAGITDIRTEGNDTVVFDLESGNADFPFVFTDYHLAIMPTKDGEPDWRSGDGCGPYKLVEFNPGVIARFERHTEDWTQERGFFDAVEMLSIVDLNARTTALISGDVQSIDKLDLKTVGLLARRPGININSIAGPQYYTFAAHTDTAPFNDVNVRMALKHAINREELIEKVLFGHGTVGNDNPIGPSYRFHNPDLPQIPYDPDRAKFHLKEAGLDGLNVTLSAADAAFPGAIDAAVLYQNSAKDAGIDLTVNRTPNDGYWADVWLKHPFCAVYWGGRPTEDQIFSTAYASDAAWNETNWSNARFNELLSTARAELDEDKRRQMYYEMQELVTMDGGSVLPMFANFVFANSEEIVHGDMASNYDVDGERWMERWSFA
ncbi:ABC transporter substrate-binding protein [Marivita sp.]|uniref:ABC transporter substrate-binding protein n=1 Tax=Marivita sp. TaxID=2003365 RepID=UPI0025C3B48E|nr:ABC transporter substrate-binding protein [Marivita sp.]